jgi:hypothetical protein
MNDPYVEARELQLLDMVAELREQNQRLTEKLEQANYERCEDQSELARHHHAFTQISGLASDIEEDLRWFAGREMKPSDETLDEWFTTIRSIRNIVG